MEPIESEIIAVKDKDLTEFEIIDFLREYLPDKNYWEPKGFITKIEMISMLEEENLTMSFSKYKKFDGNDAIRKIDLSESISLNDTHLLYISLAFPQIQDINIGHCLRITEEGFNCLLDLPLKRIDVYGCPKLENTIQENFFLGWDVIRLLFIARLKESDSPFSPIMMPMDIFKLLINSIKENWNPLSIGYGNTIYYLKNVI